MRNRLDLVDQSTVVLSKAVNALLLNSPVTTALGVMVGFFAKGVADLVVQVMKVEVEISFLLTVPGGILLMRFLRPHVKYYDESIEKSLHYLEEIHKQSNFTQEEKRQHYQELLRLAYKKIYETDVSVVDAADHDGPAPAK